MSGRSRVLDSLDHRSGGLAADIGGTLVSGAHVSVVADLREHYGLENMPVKVIEPYQMLGEVDGELMDIIGVDAEPVLGPTTLFGFENTGWKEWRTPWGQLVLVPDGFQVTRNGEDTLVYPKGDRESKPSGRMPGSGYFFDSIIRQDHFDENALDPEDNLQEFGPLDSVGIDHYTREAARARATGRAVVATMPGTGLGDIALVPAPFLADPRGIRDVTEWYVSLVSRQDYVHQVFEKQTGIALANMQRIKDVAMDNIDVAFVCGTDFGTQTSTFCSSETFIELYLPYYRRINSWIHENTPWKTFKHSCGAVADFMSLFIEAGFDIVNPVQLSATGMEPRHLKAEYGDSMVFWGGVVDTQNTLPFGTPDQVRREARERCDILAVGGGFVFNAIHNIQARTPVANIAALFDVIKEYR